MPQLDVSTFPSLLFWLSISFILLYVGLKFFILPPLERIFEERERSIENLLAKAEDLQKKAEILSQESAKKLESANHFSQESIVSTVQNLATLYTEQERILAKNIFKKEEEFERKILLQKKEIEKQFLQEIPKLVEVVLKDKLHLKNSSEDSIRKKILETIREKADGV